MIYELRKATKVESDKAYPALFVMHGIGSNELNMLSLVEGLEQSFFIFSVRGHLSHPPGFAYFTIERFGKPHKDNFDQGMEQLESFIEYACAKYPLDRSQIFLLGFSQGAISAMTLGIKLGDRINGVVALSGYIPEFVKDEYAQVPLNELRLFISHGEVDEVLPFEWGLANQEYFNQKGASVTFRTYPVGHTVSLQNKEEFTDWLLDNVTK